MTKFSCLAVFWMLLLFEACSPDVLFQEESTPPTASQIHRQATVVDAHVDTLQRVLMSEVDLGRRLDSGHLDIPRMKEGGVDAQFFAVWVDSPYRGPPAVKRALQLVDAFYRVLTQYPDEIVLAVNRFDIEQAERDGKLAALLGIEGGHAIDGDLGALRMFHRLGVRYMTLAWSNSNAFADSSGDKPRWGGLNDLGRAVVSEMNRIGMIVDISHVSDETFWDVMKVTTKPVIASHSSARALQDVPRNMTNEMLRAVARNGGVVGINFYSTFLSPSYARRARKARSPRPSVPELLRTFDGDLDRVALERYKRGQAPSPAQPPPFDVLIDHIDHVARVAGVDHVGLGSDFDGVDSLPAGMRDVTDLPKITEALLERGYTEREIRKVLGGNFLRVLQEVTER